MEKNMTIDLLSMMSNGDMEEEFVPFIDIEIDKDFERALNEDTLSFEELMESAPWQQLEGETDLQYEAFKYFVNLQIDDWEVESVMSFANYDLPSLRRWSIDFVWNTRRMSYVKSQEWLRRKKKELEHKEGISDFRDTQANLLKTASDATLSLIGKLAQRIQELDPSEIKSTDIPKYVTAVSQFIDMTTEAQARFLTLNELLCLYEDEIDSKAIREHMTFAEKERLEKNNA